jgi:hypothetical protein
MVKGRPNYVWLTVTDFFDCHSVTGALGAQVVLLQPSDWNSLNAVDDTGTQLCHIVHHHFIYGVADTATYSWSSNYAIAITNDELVNVVAAPPSPGDDLGFLNFCDQYDQLLHWGNFTAMPYSAGATGHGVKPGGGSMAAMPENMLNLNVKRNLKGDDCVIAAYGGCIEPIGIWMGFTFTRSLVRIGLK